MIDYFALLNEPRRPWIDPELLKAKFLALTAEVHPDRVHNSSESTQRAAQDRSTSLNRAYSNLRDPKDRLRHLIELESGHKPDELQNIPSNLMEAFMQVSRLCRDVDLFLAEKRAVTSPLLQVQLFERGQEWTDKLTALQKQISAWRDELVAELKRIDAAWEKCQAADTANRPATLRRLEEMYRLFSYLGRWSGQIHERIARISF